MILLSAAAFVLIISLFLLAQDRYVWSFLVAASSIAAAYYFIPEAPAMVTEIGWSTILTWYVPVFLGIGVLVAMLKWVFLVRGVASDISTLRSEFQTLVEPTNHEGVAFTQAEMRVKFVSFLHDRQYQTDDLRKISIRKATAREMEAEGALVDAITPQAKRQIDRITFWILQWPLVLISTLVEDLILKIGKHVARAFDAMFNRLTRLIIGKAVSGM